MEVSNFQLTTQSKTAYWERYEIATRILNGYKYLMICKRKLKTFQLREVLSRDASCFRVQVNVSQNKFILNGGILLTPCGL